MPRHERKRAESGIYHIMLRGINQQQIFEDEEDNLKFLQILKECKELCGFRLLAYCLMGNHVHLLLKEGPESLEHVFKRIGGRFVYWYNVKYQRVGHHRQHREPSPVLMGNIDNGFFIHAIVPRHVECVTLMTRSTG